MKLFFIKRVIYYSATAIEMRLFPCALITIRKKFYVISHSCIGMSADPDMYLEIEKTGKRNSSARKVSKSLRLDNWYTSTY